MGDGVMHLLPLLPPFPLSASLKESLNVKFNREQTLKWRHF